MQNGGFLDTNRTTKPLGLGIIILAHAAILTAVAVSHPEIMPRITYVDTKLINVPTDKEPPPLPQPVETKTQRDIPTHTDAIVKASSEPLSPVVIDIAPPPQNEMPARPNLELARADPVFVTASIDPRAQARFQPDYPLNLIRAGIEGFATVRVLIGSDGRIRAVEMVNATDPAFFEATRNQALRYWRFTPATSDGIAVESWRTMTVRFKLN